ncbi:glycosyltransferase [Novosphingobium sp.]|uniref:glycosyltransferase n=1 Tax=Novosphingobium sp. TaxID=1874826 RepID=UPI001D326CEF|nr:glycosyltransferase [Novosphingobium sp.]MBX9663897.1 glycosyltransferase [Novosphingobium sp.]
MELHTAQAFEAEVVPLDVTIVMPCLNEIQSLRHCMANALEALDRIQRVHGLAGEVVIADNGSTDGSQALAASLGARVVNVSRKGYGAAIIGGFNAAYGRFLIMGDCDGSYDFTDAVAMIGKLLDGADLCMGSRFKGGIAPGAMPWKNRYIGNPVLTGLLNLFFRTGIDDAHCGLRAIRRDAYHALNLQGSGMEFASEMVIKASLRKLRIDEVAATLSPDLRDRAPHLRPWRDGWRHLRYLFMLSPTWAFGVPAALIAALGMLILTIATLHETGLIQTSPFGESWTVIGAMLVSGGHLGLIMALATHLYASRAGWSPPARWMFALGRVLTLESFIITGAALIGAAALGIVTIAGYWSSIHYQPLSTVLPVVIASLLGSIGIQTLFAGFLLAVISGHQANFLSDLQAPEPAAAPGLVKQFIRPIPVYSVAAVALAVLHNAIMIGLDWFGVHYVLCQLASAMVLLPVGYLTMTSGAIFRTRRSWAAFASYSAILISNLPISLALLWLLRGEMALPMLVAAPLSSLVLYMWNYVASFFALNRTGEPSVA